MSYNFFFFRMQISNLKLGVLLKFKYGFKVEKRIKYYSMVPNKMPLETLYAVTHNIICIYIR